MSENGTKRRGHGGHRMPGQGTVGGARGPSSAHSGCMQDGGCREEIATLTGEKDIGLMGGMGGNRVSCWDSVGLINFR